MNTQFSGIAALTPTIGGNFVGQGGELYRINSEYDLQISNIKAQQIQAVADVQDKARQAIKTGRAEDLALAMEAYTFAKDIQNDYNKVQMDKAAALQEYQAGLLEMQKFERETSSATIAALTGAGVTIDQIPEGYFSDLDAKTGYAPGTSEAMFYVAEKEAYATDLATQIEQADAFASLFEKMKVGAPPITIGSSTYSLLDYGDETTGTESGTKGQFLWEYDHNTGETTVRKFGPPTNMSYVDFKADGGQVVRVFEDGSKMVFDPTQPDYGIPNPATMQTVFPDGYKPSDEDLAALGLTQLNADTGGIQCGQYFRLITGYEGTDLSSKATKMALIDKSIGTEGNAPQAGDAFIQDSGTYGHIGAVLGSTLLEDGSYQIMITDANSKGNGTIRYDTINSKNVAGFARLTDGFIPEFQFGTDAPSTGGLTFGGSDNSAIDAYARQVSSGAINLSTVPADVRDKVVVAAEKLRETPGVTAPGELVTLNAEDQEILEKSDETKKLKASSELADALKSYAALVEEHGSAKQFGTDKYNITLEGKQKADLENVYGIILAKYKGAESLGALDAGVERAVNNVIKDISKSKNLGQFAAPGRIRGQIRGLESSLQESASRNYAQLIAKNPVYANSAYLNELMSPFSIKVRNIQTGETGTIPPGEYDETLYEKL